MVVGNIGGGGEKEEKAMDTILYTHTYIYIWDVFFLILLFIILVKKDRSKIF